MPSTSAADFRALTESEHPQPGEPSKLDVYVYLPRAERFIRLLCKGDVWDESQAGVLKKHTDTRLFVRLVDSLADSVVDTQRFTEDKLAQEALAQQTPAEIQFLNDAVEQELEDIFKFMSDPQDTASVKTIQAMESLSQKIIGVVAPDIEDLRGTILQQHKYLMVMNDSAAITSIAVLIALAHGFNSRKVFRDLSMAILMMDAPLADIPEAIVLKYYADRAALETPDWELIRRHPARAHEVVSTKLKSVSDSVLQLILDHHELYNGKGYPRQIRNESLPPIVRSLALAVDVFDVMKREFLNSKEIDVLAALEELRELTIEAHLRRHNQKLVQSAVSYIISQKN